MSRWLWAAALLLSAATVRAQPNKLVPPSTVFLQADYSFWTGSHLYKDGKEVGPGFVGEELLDAVRGVPVAEAHAHHAEIAAITSWSFAFASVSLAVTSIVYHLEHEHERNTWPLVGGASVQRSLNIAWLASLISGVVARRIYYNELLTTVTEYNYALMRSVESEFE